MKVAMLSANLGNFDVIQKDPVEQEKPEGVTQIDFHRFTDENFPPITGMTPRMQYRLAKLFGWQLFPGYDVYIWFDSSCSLQRTDCVKWYLEKVEYADAAFFRHPQRNSIKAESEHIEEKLKINHWYITPRYKNGLHKEMEAEALADPTFTDDTLYASTAFVYRNSPRVHALMREWWFYQSRYFTCDQLALPYAIHRLPASGIKVQKIPENLFKIGYLSLVNHHK